MKKKTVLFTACMLLGMSSVAIASNISGEYNGFPVVHVVVDGKRVEGEVPGINMRGTTLVPLKVVSEALGATTLWDQSSSTVSVITDRADPKDKSIRSEDMEALGKGTSAERRELFEKIGILYGKLEKYLDNISTVRERIRIAKDYYDIKKNDLYFSKLDYSYWKTLDEIYSSILADLSSEEINKAKQEGDLNPDFLKALDYTHEAMNYYQLSVDHFTRYVSMGQSQLLDYYITSYANAFDQELKAKEMYETAYQQFLNSTKSLTVE